MNRTANDFNAHVEDYRDHMFHLAEAEYERRIFEGTDSPFDASYLDASAETENWHPCNF